MNGNILKYKEYTAKIEYSVEDKVLHGVIDGIDDLVDFCSESVDEIEEEFHAAVDDYLELCKKLGKEPNKAYTGTFNVRINPELHKKMAIMAKHNGNSLNAEVEKAIQRYIENKPLEQNSIRIDITPVQNVRQGTFSIQSNSSDWEGVGRHERIIQSTSPVANQFH